MAISLLLLAKRQAHETQHALAQNRYGYSHSPGQRLLSAGLSIGLAGAVGAAMIAALVVPDLLEPEPTVITGRHIPIATPDPIDDVPPERSMEPREPTITMPRPPLFVPNRGDPPVAPIDAGDLILPQPTDGGLGAGGGDIIQRDPPPPVEIFRGATRDPRFARSFQPTYPPALEREGITGTVRVRVRIGSDGRVISVEDLGSTDPAFFTATERQALRHWRFRPATRDGVPVESTQELTVRFQVPPRD
jgi:protein TonB